MIKIMICPKNQGLEDNLCFLRGLQKSKNVEWSCRAELLVTGNNGFLHFRFCLRLRVSYAYGYLHQRYLVFFLVDGFYSYSSLIRVDGFLSYAYGYGYGYGYLHPRFHSVGGFDQTPRFWIKNLLSIGYYKSKNIAT